MCNKCYESDQSFVCSSCGTPLSEDWAGLSPFYAERKSLKDLVETNKDSCFVWLLRYRGKIVRVGYGDLLKLYKETKPSPHYIKFDSVFVYWLGDNEWRNRFALACIAGIDGVHNRRGVESNKYVGKMTLRFRSCVPAYVRQHILEDPDYKVGDFGYYDIERLQEGGYVL
jgi:hypothetical protein